MESKISDQRCELEELKEWVRVGIGDVCFQSRVSGLIIVPRY